MYETLEPQRKGWPVRIGALIRAPDYPAKLDIIGMTIERRGENTYYVCAEGSKTKSVLHALEDFRLSLNAKIIQKEGVMQA